MNGKSTWYGKGQKISIATFLAFNSSKKSNEIVFPISALASKKWWNQKNKDTLLQQLGDI